jgi:N-acetylglucosaminyldiphosphoundecaprenol N-acetyl-beta-D-mannosaminyltransferase
MKPKRVDILGVPVDCVGMHEALEYAESVIRGEGHVSVVAVNPEKIIRAQKDPLLKNQLVSAGLLIPDGIGVVLAARLLGFCRMERVPGSEFMPALCERAAQRGYSIYLFGASQEVNDRAAEVLRKRFPGIHIVGNHHGYVGPDEMRNVIDSINGSGAQILFLALGSPSQELWMSDYLGQTRVKLCQGVGGTFDVIAGRVRRAPLIFRKIQLEWFYRLMTQPQRLFRQTALPLFAYKIFVEWILSGRKQR